MRTLNEIIPLIHRGRERIARADIDTAFQWIAELLDQVEARHRRGELHGEIGPRSIAVTGRRAMLLEPDEASALPEYRDHESERGFFRAVDPLPRRDVYGVGAVLYALLEGGAPPSGARSPFTRPVPAAAAWIASRAMAEGNARYPTARAMKVDVDRFRRLAAGRDVYDLRPDELPSYDGGAAPVVAATPLRCFEPAPVRRRRRRRVLAAVLILFGLLYYGARRHDEADVEATAHGSPNITKTTPDDRPPIAVHLATWAAEIDQRLGASGEWFRPAEVPLVVVEEGVAVTSKDLEGWNRHRSRVLAERLGEILREDPSAAELERRLGELVGDRTRPAVLYVASGVTPGTVDLRLHYRGLTFEDSYRTR